MPRLEEKLLSVVKESEESLWSRILFLMVFSACLLAYTMFSTLEYISRAKAITMFMSTITENT